MRIFVGYGYNPRDQWVETFIFPLVKALGCEVVHGKIAYGAALSDEVLRLIRESDALLAFTTRRDPAGNDQNGQPRFSTHPWVIQELTAALAQNPPLPFVEIREDGVIDLGGMVAALNAQHIAYREAERAACLLAVAEAVGKFRSQAAVTTVRLGPKEVVDQVRQLLDDPAFTCRCRILRGRTELPPQDVPVLPVKGTILVKLRGIQEGDLVRLAVSAGGRTWRSDYESVDTVDIRLEN
jgi:hypothetical protein